MKKVLMTTTAAFIGFMSTTSGIQAKIDLGDMGNKLHSALQWASDNKELIENAVDLTAGSSERLATAYAHSMGAQFNEMGSNLANFIGNPKTLAAMNTAGDVFGRNLESAGRAGGTLATGVGEGAGRALEGYGKGLGAAYEGLGKGVGGGVGAAVGSIL